MEPMSQVIFQHIVVTVIVILAGFLLGGGLGWLLARLLKTLYDAWPGLRLPFLMLPWRSFLVFVFLIFASPIAVYPFVIPQIPAALSSAILFTLLTLFFVADEMLACWLHSGFAVRLVKLGRTLAVFGSGIVALVGLFSQSGILNEAVRMTAVTFTPRGLQLALAAIIGVSLIFDLLLGAAQMRLAYVEMKGAEESAQ